MTQRALVISKDLVNELKRLAALASKDDEALDEARKRYVRAGTAVHVVQLSLRHRPV